MKKYLGYSFHKASLIHQRNWDEENLNLKASFVEVITSLERHRVKLIYLDEFCIQHDMNRMYSWAPKGKEIMIHTLPKGKPFHCLVALSEEQTEGFRIQREPFTGEAYIEFLKDHIERFGEGKIDGDEATVIVMDNAAQHRAEGVHGWAVSNGVRLLTLPPYSPELNPAEKIIGAIKGKVKRNGFSFEDGGSITYDLSEDMIIKAYEENKEP